MNNFNPLFLGVIILVILSVFPILFNDHNTMNSFISINNNDNIIYNNNLKYDNNAYVINLNHRLDRWIQINEKFKESNFRLIRVPAIKNNNGALGCGLSFLKAVKYAKDNKLDSILIFEDDNKPLDKFEERWLIIKEWLDKNIDKWDIYNGGARFQDWWLYDSKKTTINIFKTKLYYNINDIELLFTAETIVSTNWIYINKNAYERVLEWNNVISNGEFIPIDLYFSDNKIFKQVFSIPHLALQENGLSDNTKGNYNFDIFDKKLISIFEEIYMNEYLYK